MRFVATSLDLLKLELDQAFDRLANPQGPTKVYAVTSASLPPAADHLNAVVRVTDLNILAVSDGTDWVRQDTGAAIA